MGKGGVSMKQKMAYLRSLRGRRRGHGGGIINSIKSAGKNAFNTVKDVGKLAYKASPLGMTVDAAKGATKFIKNAKENGLKSASKQAVGDAGTYVKNRVKGAANFVKEHPNLSLTAASMMLPELKLGSMALKGAAALRGARAAEAAEVGLAGAAEKKGIASALKGKIGNASKDMGAYMSEANQALKRSGEKTLSSAKRLMSGSSKAATKLPKATAPLNEKAIANLYKVEPASGFKPGVVGSMKAPSYDASPAVYEAAKKKMVISKSTNPFSTMSNRSVNDIAPNELRSSTSSMYGRAKDAAISAYGKYKGN
jgi:hypothetical protein